MSSNSECAFIEDGYDVHGYIARREQLHPAISFVFRAMLKAECSRARYNIEHARTPEEGEVLAAKAIAKHVTQWDIRKRNGDPVEITADNVLRIQPVALQDMWSQVLGVQGPQARPRGENAADLYEAGPDQRQEELDAKN